MISNNISGKELYNFFFFKNGIFNSSLYNSLDNDNIYKKLFNEIYNEKLKIYSKAERKYRLINEVFDIKRCPVCGKELKFLESKGKFQNHCSTSCALLDKHARDSFNNTCNKKYGSVENFYKEIKRKREEKCLLKYNSKSYLGTKDCLEKTKITKQQKYGDANWNNQEKINNTLKNKNGNLKRNNGFEKTIFEKYGETNYLDVYYKSHKRNSIDIQNKISNTKRNNGTFNSSKPENLSYKLLKEKFDDVIYQYKSKEYPFICDFYIPSLKLYIECNYHWTHGFRPFNEKDNECIRLLNQWKECNTKYYNNAITTWTVRDVQKRKVAMENSLNYKEFWNIDELKEFIYEQK